MRSFRPAALCAVVLSTGLYGCVATPASGPDDGAIRSLAAIKLDAPPTKPLLDYALIDVTPEVLSYFPRSAPQTFSRGFGPTRQGVPVLPLGVGDVVEITLFESSAGGLFVPTDAGSRPGNFINLPNQTVASDGSVSVPYAGRIQAAGRTPVEVQREIEARLRDRAIEPQAIINLVRSRSSEISVLGEVTAAAKLEINPAGERVLDVLSRAGGISAPSAETNITLQRRGTTATVPFEALLDNPNENIYVFPGDVVFASRDRRTYLALGAAGLNGRLDFEDSDLTVAEAMAKAGGLLDGRADPAQVFLYRLVDPTILERMGIPVAVKGSQGFPVIFRANVRDPAMFFLIQQMPMEDKDIIYIANADAVETSKVLSVINTVTAGTAGPFIDAAAIHGSVRAISR